MKKLMLLLLVSISILSADINKDIKKATKRGRANITFMKINSSDYDTSYKELGNKTIRWIVKTKPKYLIRLISHVYYMRHKMNAGYTPRKNDLLFVAEDRMAKYIHYKFDFDKITDGILIIDKSADNDCAYAIIKKHADIIQNDFFKGDLSKNYSDVAKEIIASPACKDFRNILK